MLTLPGMPRHFKGKKKPNLSIGLNWVRENEFLEEPKETTGWGMPHWHSPINRRLALINAFW